MAEDGMTELENKKGLEMEQLTKDELQVLAELLKNAQVRVADSALALTLLAKLQRMIENDGSAQSNKTDTPHPAET